ncbi:MAG: M16 family metallopeptidase, partial [Verrucomicrobiota bacterium]
MTSHSSFAEAAKVPALPESRAEIFTYDNGLTLIVEEDRSAPVASVQAWCGTGSIHEGEWMGAGLSHILEHMLFKGTEKRPPGAIADQIQRRGGYINAYTSFDRTVYWIDTPVEGASEAVEILADVMQNATLPEDEYAKEQEVIRREFAMGFDDPNRQASELMLRTVFSESPFRHPVIGYLDVYNKLTRGNVLDYYKSRYVPNNITFVVVGDVDAAKIREELGELFKTTPRQAIEPLFIASEPPQLGRREIHEEFPTELSRLSMAWRIPGVTHPDTPALEILGEILGSGSSSRLNREIRERKEIAHQAGAGMYSLQTEGIFVMQAVTDPDKRDTAERESLAVLEDLKKNGITDAELERARRSILAAQIQGLTTMRGKASDLGSNWMLARNLNFTRHYLDEIAKVTKEDIQRVANKYLTPESINVTSLNPPGTVVAKSDASNERADGEIQKFTLPNGLRLLVREDSRLPLVSINAVFRGGLLAETRETNGITRLYSHALLKGTKNRTAEQIADEIEGVGGSIVSDSGNNSFNIGIDVMSPDLALGVEVLSDILVNFWIWPSTRSLAASDFATTVPGGLSEVTLIDSGVRYLLATRWM